jgi:hypothetical protein
MAPLATDKLRILTFPQRIAGRALELNVLLMPTQGLLNLQDTFASVLNPGGNVDLPQFITANLELELTAIRGLASYPFSDPALLAADGATLEPFATGATFPPGMTALYEGLASQFDLGPTNGKSAGGALTPLADSDGIRKYLPRSYRSAFNFTTPRTHYASTDDTYHCAIKRSSQRNPAFPKSNNRVTWGRVIAFCLRQPLLAERAGLLHRIPLTLPIDDYFKEGGWLACRLTPAALVSFGVPDAEVRSYAARIPPIDRDRQLFASVLFPFVKDSSQLQGNFDTLKIEASDYDDGFAKIVHAMQPVSANLLSEEPDGIHVQKDIGVRLGWDDEQLLIWQNRQMLADPSMPLGHRIEAPLGVFFHRVDVREKGDANWHSLVRVQNKAALTLAGQTIAPTGTPIETGVQVFPAKINGDADATFWLPSYFTQWYGPSLVLPDLRAAQLDASGALASPGTYSDANIPANPGQPGNLYEPLLPENCDLKYGHEYEFRVRFGDLTGGGPRVDDTELNDAPATSSKVVFRRYVAPKQLSVTPDDPQGAPDAGSVQFYDGTSFTVQRPRLGYPALLFTTLDTEDAFNRLLDDKTWLHTGKVGAETIKEPRQVSGIDPDVDGMLVVVDVRTLQLDNEASATQREPYIRLYSTVRRFAADLETPFTLTLEYRTANVIDFGNEIDLGDLGLSRDDIDNRAGLVLPTSRDIRITLYPICLEKDGLPEYFGFAKTRVDEELYRAGESLQFFVREDAEDEVDFFLGGLESHQLQGIYLQPDPPQVNNAVNLVAATVAGSELHQPTIMERLAAQLGLDCKGLTLIGKPGVRIQFGCSNRIRHTLAPDNSSLTFATVDELLNHWLCVLSFDVGRDWTWDGLSDAGIEIRRSRQFTGEADTLEADRVVGQVIWHRTANRLATTKADRSYTRILFVDAVEPKKDRLAPSTATHPYPNTQDVSYVVTPQFIPSVIAFAAARAAQTRFMQLPVTTIPAQVPKIVGAGYALSPYERTHDYSETAVRERYLWLEFDAPIADPNDTYFARILAYAPDPLLTFPNPDQVLVRQDDPPLAISSELIRVITHGQGNDDAGLDAMQPLTAETAAPATPLIKITPVHYLMPLPPGLHPESPELFGFFTYEFRVGHTNRIWCTAQGRFGHPTRLSGVQHPVPPLKVLVERTPSYMLVTAPHANAVFAGRNVTSQPPKTEIWCMLYAQVVQADAAHNRNLLLAEARLESVKESDVAIVGKRVLDRGAFLNSRSVKDLRAFNGLPVNLDAPALGVHSWTDDEIRTLLHRFHLQPDTPLSVLAVEMMPRYDRFIMHGEPPDDSVRPLSSELGQYRILRTSPLVAAPEVCCVDC